MNISRALTKSGWRAVAIFLVLAAVFVVVTRPRGASALEKWKRELESRGEKLSVADLTPPPGPHNDTNLNELQLAAGRLETRAISPGYIDPLAFIAPGRAQPVWAEAQVKVGTAKTSTWATVGVEMKAAREDLDQICAAASDLPGTSDFEYGNPNFVRNHVAVREAAQWLSAAALYDLHENRLSAAQQRLHASIKLIRLHRDDANLVSQMIRVAIAGLALDVTWAALQRPGWTESSLSELQGDWETTHFLEKFAPAMKMERALRANFFAYARTNGFNSVRSRVTGPRPAPIMGNDVQAIRP